MGYRYSSVQRLLPIRESCPGLYELSMSNLGKAGPDRLAKSKSTDSMLGKAAVASLLGWLSKLESDDVHKATARLDGDSEVAIGMWSQQCAGERGI